MKYRIIALGWLAGSLFCGFCYVKAADVVPCLIFTGNSDAEHCVDLAKLNRITFGDDGMTISSSKDNSVQEVQFLYSLYHHLEIGDATPTEISTAIDEIGVDENSRLLFQSDTKSIRLESSSELPYDVGIFSLKGTLLATSKLCGGQTLSVEALNSGVYVAVATTTNGESKLTLKFILN